MAFPADPDDFLNLDFEQQVDLLLAELAAASDGQRGTNLILSQLEIWFRNLTSGLGSPLTFGALRPKREEVDARLRDAYAMLESRALIRPNPRQRAFCEITAAGQAHLKAQTPPDMARVSFARRALDAFSLHSALQAQEVESHFLQGRFETALRDGSTYLEDAIRTISGLASNLVGVKLASKAFAPSGPLADPNRQAAEQTGLQQLFTGYVGAVRNLLGHQNFRYTENKKALQQLMLLDLLVGELAEAAARLNKTLP